MKTKKMLSLLLSLILVFSLCTSFSPASLAADTSDCYIKSAVGKMPATAPNINGTVADGEWGDPIIVTSPEHVDGKWLNGYRHDGNKTANADQRAKVWMTNDKDYIYLAGTLDMEGTPTTWSNDSNTNIPMMKVMLGSLDETGKKLQTATNGQELRTVVMLRFAKDATLEVQNTNFKAYQHQESGQESKRVEVTSKLSGGNCRFKYHADTRTYHYEVRIPYSVTNIDLNESNKIAMAVMFAGSQVGTTNNAYYVGGYTGTVDGETKPCGIKDDYGNTDQATYTVTYADGSVKDFFIPMTLNSLPDAEYVNQVAAPMPATAPNINGTVADGEWGDPIIVTSPEHVDGKWLNGYRHDSNKTDNADQRAKVWMTNDKDYIYLAGTLDMEETPTTWSNDSYQNIPMMKVMLGSLDETGKKLQTATNGQELRTVVMLRFAKDATLEVQNTNFMAYQYQESGRVSVADSLKGGNCRFKYHKDTQTYHYEVRIPYSVTNIDLNESNKIAMAVMFAGSQVGTTNNAYYVGGYTGTVDGETKPCGIKDDYGNTDQATYTITYADGSVKDFFIPMTLNALSLQDMLSNAESGETVTLTKDYTVESLSVPSGVTLDLNAHTLTVTEGLVAMNAMVVDGEGKSGTGLIQAEFIQVNQNNSQLPLYDTEAGGYRLYTYKFMGKIRTENVPANAWKYAVRLELPTADAYALLADEANQEMVGLDLQLLNADGTAHSEIIPCRFSAETMQKYADLSQDLNVQKALALKVFGKDKVEENGLTLVAAARLVTRTGVDLTPNFE